MLFKDITLTFRTPFTVITGETGSGKTLLVNALRILSGARVEKNLIPGSGKSIIEAVFQLPEGLAREIARRYDVDFNGAEVIIRRELLSTGRTRAFVNDTPVSIDILSNIARRLIHIQSQHALLDFRNPAYVITLLDKVSGGTLSRQYSELYQRYMSLLQEKERIKAEYDALLPQKEFLSATYDELKTYPLEKWAQENVEHQIETLKSSEQIRATLQELSDLLEGTSDSTPGIISLLSRAKKLCNRLAELSDEHFRELPALLEACLSNINEVSEKLYGASEELNLLEEKIHELEEVRDKLFYLQHKYKKQTLEDLLKFKRAVEAQLQKLNELQRQLDQLDKSILTTLNQLVTVGEQLHKDRLETAYKLINELNNYLRELNMLNAAVQIASKKLEHPAPHGLYEYSLLFRSHPSKSFLPLHKIASGGEQTRIMLAIQRVMVQLSHIPVLILDEPDTGISGETALALARFLKKLSEQCQLIVISHLPAVVASATTHWQVIKEEKDDTVTSYVKELSHKERLNEIAYLIAGSHISAEAVKTASRLLKEL